jgi:acyl-coenzyme A thioesterase PaaI-like protein
MANAAGMTRSRVLSLYEKLSALPLGRSLFSLAITKKAPYFASIKPEVLALRPNYCEVRIKKRRAVQNHLGTVHVIAIINGLEMAMGTLAEASIPAHLRWIPKGMEVSYTAKATGDITAIAEVSAEAWQQGPEVDIDVRAVRPDGTVVVMGKIRLWVTEKPAKA